MKRFRPMKHKSLKDKGVILLGEETSPDKMIKKGRSTYPIGSRDDILGHEGTLTYKIRRRFKPIEPNSDFKIKTLDNNLMIELLNNPSIYIEGVRAYEKGRGPYLIKLAEKKAKIEGIKHTYFATNIKNEKMVTVAYRLGYEVFAEQGVTLYFGKRLEFK